MLRQTYRYCSRKSSSSSSSSSASSSKSLPSRRFSCASLRASTRASSIMGVGEGGFSGMTPCLRRISFLQARVSGFCLISQGMRSTIRCRH